MNAVKFSETIFSDQGKKGNLQPDSEGYVKIIVGALNCTNSAGEFYTAEGALDLFESSSALMRRIKNGALYAELGHPKKLPNMTMEQFYNRVLTVEETNVCGHISEITLDFKYGEKNPSFGSPDMIAIIAKVKPVGPNASTLQSALENPKQNAAFSVRGLTENKLKNSRVTRTLTNIVTWDHVLEPGISAACKANSPGLESFNNPVISELNDVTVDKALLKRVLATSMANVATENSRLVYKDILDRLYTDGGNVRSKLSSW